MAPGRGGAGARGPVDPRTVTINREQVMKEGWLQKQSKYLGTWRSRWCVLTPDFLCSFRAPPTAGEQPTEVLRLSECSTVKSADEELRKENAFRVDTPNRIFFLVAENTADKESWIGHIGRQMVRPSVIMDDDDYYADDHMAAGYSNPPPYGANRYPQNSAASAPPRGGGYGTSGAPDPYAADRYASSGYQGGGYFPQTGTGGGYGRGSNGGYYPPQSGYDTGSAPYGTQQYGTGGAYGSSYSTQDSSYQASIGSNYQQPTAPNYDGLRGGGAGRYYDQTQYGQRRPGGDAPGGYRDYYRQQ